MKQTLMQTLRVGLATFMAVVLSGVLPVGVAYANTSEGAQVGISTAAQPCPSDYVPGVGGWLKVEPLDEPTEIINVPEGYTVEEVCTFSAGERTDDADFTVNDDGTITVTSSAFNNQGIIQDLSHVSLKLVVVPEEDEEGVLQVDTNCEEITVTYSGIVPVGATVVVEDNGSEVSANTPNIATAGEHTIVLKVNDEIVDTKVVVVDECDGITPALPTVVATAEACVEGEETTSVEVVVTNTNDETDEPENYTVRIVGSDLGDQTTGLVEDGETGTVTFNGVPAGTHTVEVYLDETDETKVAETTVTVEKCETIYPIECKEPSNGGVVTQNTANWNIVGDAEFVDGGLQITSDNWVDGGIAFSGTYNISEVLDLEMGVDTDDVSGAYGVGILLETPTGAVIHYEPTPYTDDFWTNAAGILPPNAGGQGGAYSGSLQDILDTAGDLEIVKTTFVFTSATSNQVVLTSLAFNCTTYTFDEAAVADIPTFTVTKDPCEPLSNTVDVVKINVTNTNDDTDATVTYTVTLAGSISEEITLLDGATGTVTFTGLPVGTHSVTVEGDDETEAVASSVTVNRCAGAVLGDTDLTDLCPNITGTQSSVPNGMVKNSAGNCVPVGGQGQGGFVLATNTSMPNVLADTGENANPFVNAIVGFAIFALALGSSLFIRKQEA